MNWPALSEKVKNARICFPNKWYFRVNIGLFMMWVRKSVRSCKDDRKLLHLINIPAAFKIEIIPGEVKFNCSPNPSISSVGSHYWN
jgi:hypothetical protein